MELRNRTHRKVDGISDYEYSDSDDDLYVSFVTPSNNSSSSTNNKTNNTKTTTMAAGSLLESVKNSNEYVVIEIAQIVIQPSEIQLSTQKLQDNAKSNLGLVFRKPSQICIVMVDENKEIAFELDQVAKFRFSDETRQKEILLDMKKGFKKEFYEFPLGSLDVRLQNPDDPSNGKLDNATTIIFKIRKDVDNGLIVKLINNIKQWKSKNVKQPSQSNTDDSQNANVNNIVNQEVEQKGTFPKPARDDLCDNQVIQPDNGISTLKASGNSQSESENQLYITCIFITKKYALQISFDTDLKQLASIIEKRYNVKISMDRLYYLNHVGEKISLIDEDDWDVAKKEAMNAETFRISLIIE